MKFFVPKHSKEKIRIVWFCEDNNYITIKTSLAEIADELQLWSEFDRDICCIIKKIVIIQLLQNINYKSAIQEKWEGSKNGKYSFCIIIENMFFFYNKTL